MRGFSALQRAEIAEISRDALLLLSLSSGFSALQRAEIAEIHPHYRDARAVEFVSVLFNEPKLLKCRHSHPGGLSSRVSVLFNEPKLLKSERCACTVDADGVFQCSSTSRNC